MRKKIRKQSVEVKGLGIRNATDEKALRKESVKVKRQTRDKKTRNATDEKVLRKELVKIQRMNNATYYKALTKVSVKLTDEV